MLIFPKPGGYREFGLKNLLPCDSGLDRDNKGIFNFGVFNMFKQ